MPRAPLALTALTAFLPASALAWADTGAPSAPVNGPPAPRWELTASLAAYLLPDAADFLQPTITGDRTWLHLEGRYNYEDLRTGSFFVGWNYLIGDNPNLAITPMVGGVVGLTDGIALGLSIALAWRALRLRSDSEYVFNLHDAADSFFYSWSEVGAQLGKYLSVGLVEQRTKVFRTPRALAFGPWLGASFGNVDAAAYLFDPFDDTRFVVLSVAAAF